MAKLAVIPAIVVLPWSECPAALKYVAAEVICSSLCPGIWWAAVSKVWLMLANICFSLRCPAQGQLGSLACYFHPLFFKVSMPWLQEYINSMFNCQSCECHLPLSGSSCTFVILHRPQLISCIILALGRIDMKCWLWAKNIHDTFWYAHPALFPWKTSFTVKVLTQQKCAYMIICALNTVYPINA